MTLTDRTNERPTVVLVHATDIVAGGERSLLNLVRHLDRDKFHAQVVCDATDEFVQSIQQTGTPVHRVRLPGLRRPGLAAWRAVRDLLASCRIVGDAVFHANTRARTSTLPRLAVWLAFQWSGIAGISWKRGCGTRIGCSPGFRTGSSATRTRSRRASLAAGGSIGSGRS